MLVSFHVLRKLMIMPRRHSRLRISFATHRGHKRFRPRRRTRTRCRYLAIARSPPLREHLRQDQPLHEVVVSSPSQCGQPPPRNLPRRRARGDTTLQRDCVHARRVLIYLEPIAGALNAYHLGCPGDYNQWKALWNDGWGYDDLEPYFVKSEKNQSHPASRYRGTQGEEVVVYLFGCG